MGRQEEGSNLAGDEKSRRNKFRERGKITVERGMEIEKNGESFSERKWRRGRRKGESR